MRWLKYLFMTLAGLLIFFVALLLTFAVLLDDDHYREALVFVVDKTTDHRLEINGPLEISFSKSPLFSVEDIHFETADKAFELSSAELRLQVDIIPLLTKHLVVREFLARDSVVNIRQQPGDDEEDASTEPLQLNPPVIQNTRIENLAIHYLKQDETEPLHLKLDSLQLDDKGDSGPVLLSGAGTLDDAAFHLEGEFGEIATLLAGDQPYPVKYRFDFMEFVIEAEGTISNPHEDAKLDIAVRQDAPDMKRVLEKLHVDTPDIGQLTATYRLVGTLDELQMLDLDINVSKENVSLQLTGNVGRVLPAGDVNLDLSAAVADKALLAWLLPAESPAINSIKASGKLSGSEGDLSLGDISVDATGPGGQGLKLAGSTRIVDAPQPFRDMNTTLSLSFPDTTYFRTFVEDLPKLGPVAANARLSTDADTLVIKDIKLTVGDAKKLLIGATGDIRLADLGGDKPLAGLELVVNVEAPSTASLEALTGTAVPALGRLKGKAQISDAGGVVAIKTLDVNVNKGEDFRFSLTGSLADLEKMNGIDMQLELLASDLNAIGQLFGQTLPKEEQVKLSGRAKGSLDQLHYTSRTNLRNTTISTDMTGTFTGKRPRLAGSITIPDLDLHDIGIYPERRAVPADTSEPREFDEVASEQAARAEDLFSKEPIDFSALKVIDLDLEVTIKKLSSTIKPITDIYSHILLKNGQLDIKPLKFTVDNDVINNVVMINSATSPPAVSLQTNGDDIDLGLLLANTASKKSPVKGEMTARADMKSRGRSPAELAANLDGEINVIAENAQIDKSAMNLVTVDVIGWAISNMLSPNKDVNIDCAIFIMHFNKGMGTTDLNIIDTPDTLIRIDSNFDLVKQTMDIAILPEHKVRLFKTKKDPMEIYGPIADPQYKLVSVKDMAQEAGRAWVLSPLTISTSLLDNITGLIVEPDKPEPGSCDKFLK